MIGCRRVVLMLVISIAVNDDAGGATSKQAASAAAAPPPGIPRARSRLWHTGASGEGDSLQNAVEAFKVRAPILFAEPPSQRALWNANSLNIPAFASRKVVDFQSNQVSADFTPVKLDLYLQAGETDEIASGQPSWEGGRASPAPLPAPGARARRIPRRSSLSNMAGLSSAAADDGIASLPPVAPLSSGRAPGLPAGPAPVCTACVGCQCKPVLLLCGCLLHAQAVLMAAAAIGHVHLQWREC